jgi:hypothetical protein
MLAKSVCGNSVTNMYCAYANCINLTGMPICGDSVEDFRGAYLNCSKLNGSPICGNNVTTMGYISSNNHFGAYSNCTNLMGAPVCGNKVQSMVSAYYNCYRLNGPPACGISVTNMNNAYRLCPNIYGNAYFYSRNVSDVANCFTGRNRYNKLNIYCYENSTTYYTLCRNNTYSVLGINMSWSNNGICQYNTYYNIYIYPVANVIATY